MRAAAVVVFVLAMLPLSAVADSKECNCRTFSVSGTLPEDAIGQLETSDAQTAAEEDRSRPLLEVPLDESRSPGQRLHVRLSKTALSNWQAEVFLSKPAPGSTPARVLLPISFGEDGKSINTLCGEVRPPMETADNFGDHLFLCFDQLHQGYVDQPLQVSLSKVESCPCFEYATTVASIPTRYYGAEEGYEAMLHDTPAKGAQDDASTGR